MSQVRAVGTGVALLLSCLSGCLNFDKAYESYCGKVSCTAPDGGTSDAGVDAGCLHGFCLVSTYDSHMELASALCGSSRDNVWLMGSNPRWAQWDGTSWRSGGLVASPGWLRACGVSENFVWAASTSGIFQKGRASGSDWTAVGAFNGLTPFSLWVVSESEQYVVGENLLILQGNGSTEWKVESGAVDGGAAVLRRVTGAAGRVWAAGSDESGRGLVLRREDAGVWVHETLPSPRPMNGLFALDAQRVFAVGKEGTVVERETEGSWRLHEQFTLDELLSVWASSSTDVLVGSRQGRLWHFNGVEWKEVVTEGIQPSMRVFDILAFGNTDVIVGATDYVPTDGGYDFNGGFVFRYRRGM